MSSDVARFHQHLEDCYQCSEHPQMLCDYGIDLLFEAVDDLDDEWQARAGRIRKEQRLEREAKANADYYAGDLEF